MTPQGTQEEALEGWRSVPNPNWEAYEGYWGIGVVILCVFWSQHTHNHLHWVKKWHFFTHWPHSDTPRHWIGGPSMLKECPQSKLGGIWRILSHWGSYLLFLHFSMLIDQLNMIFNAKPLKAIFMGALWVILTPGASIWMQIENLNTYRMFVKLRHRPILANL